MKFSDQWFETTVTLIIGWILNEAGRYLLDRRERRRAISSALSDLLEIRHRFSAFDVVAHELSPLIPVTPNVEAQIRSALPAYMEQLFPGWKENCEQLCHRYNDSVSLVASVDAVLGHQLRSKELAQHFVQMLNGLASQDPKVAPFWPEFDKAMREELGKEFDSSIARLAWKLSPLQRWRVNRLLRKKPNMPEAVKRLLDILKEMAQKQVTSTPEPAPKADSATT